MILRIEDLKETCSAILPAVDSNELSSLTETLALEVVNKVLYLSVTNREYFVKVQLPIGEEVDFKATVNANLFLKLVSQTTTDTIELSVSNSNLVLKGNGTYKLPLIYDNDKLLELPEITINNVTASFDIPGATLNSILTQNTKQLSIGTISKLVQKMYYMDEKGALTFTSGACINNFTLPKPLKVLFNQRLVKLFKLLKDSTVKFSLGHDALTDDIIQTKVRFETPTITITSILSCDDTMLNTVPVDAIRQRANNVYPYSASINKQSLMDSINRMRLFVTTTKSITSYAKFSMSKSQMVISDLSGENKEVIYYNNDIDAMQEDTYSMYLDLVDLSAVLDTCFEANVQLNFGDNQAITISRGNIINVIPEVRLD